MSMSDNFFSIVLAVVFIALNANLFHVPIVLHLWVKVERFGNAACEDQVLKAYRTISLNTSQKNILN